MIGRGRVSELEWEEGEEGGFFLKGRRWITKGVRERVVVTRDLLRISVVAYLGIMESVVSFGCRM